MRPATRTASAAYAEGLHLNSSSFPNSRNGSVLCAPMPAAAVARRNAARLAVSMGALALRRPCIAFSPKASVTLAWAAKALMAAQRVWFRQNGTGLAVAFWLGGSAHGNPGSTYWTRSPSLPPTRRCAGASAAVK